MSSALLLMAACANPGAANRESQSDVAAADAHDGGGDAAVQPDTSTQPDAGSDAPAETGGDARPDATSTVDEGSPLQAFESCQPSGAEVCDNGLDDDCDGLVDEGCGCAPANAVQSCYLGSPSDLVGSDTACQAGSQTCVQEFWSECTGAVGPVDEVCGDGLDNNCDGQVDEGCTVDQPPQAICPPPGQGPVLREYTLQGGFSDPAGLAMASASWTQLSWPPGHSHDVQSNGLQFSFFADVAGVYELRLTVTNTAGQSDSCETSFEAVTSDVLRIEMYWNPDYVEGGGNPPDPTDVDLLLHRSATGSYTYYNTTESCYWNNCATCQEPYNDDTQREVRCRAFLAGAPPADYPPGEPWPAPVLSWDPGGTETDPRLDLDDVQGKGPENINIRRPNPGTYRVAVHYFDDEGFGPSTAYVRILCAGEQIFASEGVTLQVHGTRANYAANDIWEVGDVTISYDGAGVPTCTFDELGGAGCHRICALSDANDGGCAPASCE